MIHNFPIVAIPAGVAAGIASFSRAFALTWKGCPNDRWHYVKLGFFRCPASVLKGNPLTSRRLRRTQRREFRLGAGV